MARIVNFVDGAQSETTPVIGNIVASNLVQYANDAAYEAGEDGAPVVGNVYYNTTDNVIRYYNGTVWQEIVDESTTQALENKAIDADTNMITNIDNNEIKPLAGIEATKLADGSVTDTELQYINSLSSNAQDQIDGKISTTEKGAINGVAELDGSGKVPATQLPSYVDDVEEYADFASFPVTGETGKIYIAIDTGFIYRWSGAIYVDISGKVDTVNGQTGTVVLDTDDIAEGAVNKYATGSIDTHSDVDTTTTPPSAGDVLEWDGSNWVPAVGGSGSGSKNYIDTASAELENDIGSWETDNGAGSAASFLTLSQETSVQLAGVGSLKVVKSANDATGEFVKLTTQTIDLTDRGKALFGSFSFDATDANYASSDFVLEIYDNTNAAVLYSGVAEDLELLATKGRFDFVTYTETTTASIEVRLKVNSTNATAYSLYFDEFKLGPAAQVQTVYQKSQLIDVSGDANFTAGEIQVERVGNIVSITVPTTITFSSSSNITSATAWVPDWARPTQAVQNEYTGTTGAFIITINADGTFRFTFDSARTSSLDAPTISYTVPDTTGPTLNENELSLQTVRVTGQVSTASHTNSGNYQDISYTEDRDTHGTYDGTTFTAPRAGYYTFSAHIQFGSNATGRRGLQIVLTDADDSSLPGTLIPASTTGAFGIVCTGTVYMEKGGTAIPQAFQDSGGTLTYGNGVFSVVGNPDYTVLGAVKNYEYLEASATNTTTVTADTEIDVTGLSLDLTPGTWKIGYDLSLNINENSGAANAIFGRVRITDSSNTVLAKTASIAGGTQVVANSSIYYPASAQTEVVITSDTTYKVRVACNESAAAGEARVFNGDVTGGLTGDDVSSVMWAERIK